MGCTLFSFSFFMAKKGGRATIVHYEFVTHPPKNRTPFIRKCWIKSQLLLLYNSCEWPQTLSYPYERANKLGVNFQRQLHLLLLWGPQTSSYPYNRAGKLGVNGNSTIRIGPQDRERVGCTRSHRYKGNPRPPIIRQKTKLKKLTFLTNISALVAQ